MTTVGRHLLGLLVGPVVIGYCVNAIRTGYLSAPSPSSRRDEPWKFWSSVIFMLIIGVVILCGPDLSPH
jgi:hypothetical protein